MFNFQNKISKFRFPQSSKIFTKVNDSNDLRERFNQQKKNSRYYAVFLISRKKTSISGQSEAIYSRCSKCKATLNYKLNPQTNKFQLLKFNNEHSHRLRQKKNSQRLYSILKTFPSNLSSRQILQLAKKQIKFKKAQFYFTMSKIKRQVLPPVTQMPKHIESLQYGQYFFVSDTPDSNFPNTPIFSRYYFNIYKDYRTKDYVFYFHQFQLKSKAKINIGIIAVSNVYGKFLVCALLFMKQKKSQYISQMLQQFRKLTFNDYINIIIPYDPIITDAIQSLNKNQMRYYYLYEGKSVESSLTSWNNDYKIFKSMKHLHFKQNLENILDRFYRDIWPQTNLFNEIIRKPQHFFISAFNSLDLTTICALYQIQPYQKINKILHSQIRITKKFRQDQFLTSFYIIINALYTINKQKQQEQKKIIIHHVKYEMFFQQQQLHQLRHLLSKAVFNIFLKHYATSFKCQLVSSSSSSSFVVQLGGLSYSLDLENNKIKCNCGFYKRFGLPCCHQIKVIKTIQPGQIKKYMSQVWVINDQIVRKQKERPRKKAGRPKSSRRNMSK